MDGTIQRAVTIGQRHRQTRVVAQEKVVVVIVGARGEDGPREKIGRWSALSESTSSTSTLLRRVSAPLLSLVALAVMVRKRLPPVAVVILAASVGAAAESAVCSRVSPSSSSRS